MMKNLMLISLCVTMACKQPIPADNKELQLMYNADQSARNTLNIDWKKVSATDKVRQLRTKELIDSNKLATAKDYYNAALIFQHGQNTSDYQQTILLMKKAIAMDTSIDRWLLAAAIDRELDSRKKPQIYGTQFERNNSDGKWFQVIMDTTIVSDSERIYYHVETLAEQRLKLHNMNLKNIRELNTGNIAKMIIAIKQEFRKGLSSTYYISSNEMNNYGYELMNENKLADAKELFYTNTLLYPNNANAYDSYGEILLKLNLKNEAIIAYEKSLAINPKNTNAKKILELNK